MFSTADHGQLMLKIHQGNYGAREVCFKIFNSYDFAKSEEIFKKLIDQDVTGSKLWSLYKDTHLGNLEEMIDKLLTL